MQAKKNTKLVETWEVFIFVFSLYNIMVTDTAYLENTSFKRAITGTYEHKSI